MARLTIAALALAGCTFVAGGDIETQPCMIEGETDFAAGNALCRTLQEGEPTDPCQVWVCRAQVGNERFCTLGAPDEDDDGVGSAECLGLDAGGDCDDADPTTSANAPELCDGKDNDCDGRIDEGILQVGSPTRVGELQTDRLAFGADGDQLAAVYRNDDGKLALWRPGTDTEVVLAYDGTELRLRDGASPIAALPLDGSRTLVAAALTGCDRIVVGVANAAGALQTTSEDFASGLVATDGNRCPDRTDGRAPAGRGVTLAASDSSFLATWLEAESIDDCRAATAVTVAASGGEVSPPTPSAAAASHLGEGTNARGGTAALALGGERFLTARFSASDAIGFAAGALATDGSLVPTFTSTRELRGKGQDLSLVRGERGAESGQVLALAVAGCDAPITVAQRLALEADGNLTMLGDPVPLPDGGRPQRRPAAAWSDRPEGYLVAWLEGNGVRAQLLGRGGSLLGDPLAITGADAFEGGASFPHGLVVTPRAEGGFDVHLYVETAASGIYRIPVVCGGE